MSDSIRPFAFMEEVEMNIGLTTGISTYSVDVAVLAQKAESLGFESFWLPEHTIVPVDSTSRYGGTPDGSIPPSMSCLLYTSDAADE